MVEIDKVLDISNNLLRELLSRSSSDNCAFRIAESFLPFSVVDEFFVLGFPVVGEEVKMENDGGGLVNRLFDDGEKIKL